MRKYRQVEICTNKAKWKWDCTAHRMAQVRKKLHNVVTLELDRGVKPVDEVRIRLQSKNLRMSYVETNR